jgi:hypothetical protein
MGELTNAGFTPEDIIAYFIRWRVSPLQRRTHNICQMSRATDPTRHSMHELSPADILWQVKDICKTMQTVFAWGLELFSREHPMPPVNHLALADIFVHDPTYLLSQYISILTGTSHMPAGIASALVFNQLSSSFAEI